MGIILAPIALLLFVVVFILEAIFSLFFEVGGRKWYELISKRMYEKAKLVDIFGNYLFGDFWNWFLSDGKGYPYGVLGETISSATGKKSIDKTLNFWGWVLYYMLYIIDIPSWKYGGHCKRWIMTEEQIQEFFNKYAVDYNRLKQKLNGKG